jgi:hypothetical protein
MIVNLPTPQSLNETALRLYFSAWSSLIDIRADFDTAFDPGTAKEPGRIDWSQEWSEYLEGYQPELQAVCSVIQQSNELALKAKICAVSPYLLLLGSEPRFSAKVRDIDFSEFRTLDAVDLPASVNSLCPHPLSDGYITDYNHLRVLRNRFTHLGQAGQTIEPKGLLELLIRQYIGLWSDRAWLVDRANFAARTGAAFLHDGKYSAAASAVIDELPLTFAQIGKSAFKKLFGIGKTTRRYLCHRCIREASTRFYEVNPNRSKTAFLKVTGGQKLHCLMCDKDYEVERRPCCIEGCKGDVISKDEYHEADVCHICGQVQDSE